MHRPSTVAALAEAFLVTLRSLVAHCRSVRTLTPDDFPEMDFNQQELDALLVQLGEVLGDEA